MAQAYWMYTLENLNSLINLEINECSTLQILRTSYKELPMHLKPCFLYMGIFPEDDEIKTSLLIKLWVAEGILRPINDKSLEEVAKVYLKELIDRNLIIILELRWDGEVRFCKIHDLLRDLCLREAHKQKFFRNHGSFLYKGYEYDVLSWVRFRLVRVHSTADGYNNNSLVTCSNDAIFKQANLRYLSLRLKFWDSAPRLLSLCSLLWNLQTLKVDGLYSSDPLLASVIWEMPLLRHVMLDGAVLPVPPDGEHNFVLKNLQTLSNIINFKCSEEVIKRIPNLKKLKVMFGEVGHSETNLCLNKLGRLQNLESFYLLGDHDCDMGYTLRNLVSFPHSLKKLSLNGTELNWEDLTIRIGSLPLLRVLKLHKDACLGPKWETVEGQFCSLRVLQISFCCDLKYWDTDGAHFPHLEHLLLHFLVKLEEIPLSIGDIPTLKSIWLQDCSDSADDSAERIKEEQEENGNEELQVIIVKDRDLDKKVRLHSDEEDQVYSDEDQVDSDETTRFDSI